MAFGSKLTKDDLIAAGLDPDKLAEFQSKGVTKDMLDTLKTELTTQLTTTITDQLKAGFTELENKLRTPEPKGNGGGNGGNGGNEPEPVSDFDSFTTDPVAHINNKVSSLARATAVEVMKTRRQIAEDSLRSTLTGFKNEALKTEIEEEWKKYTPDVLARNNSDPYELLKKIHNMVLGAHQDDILRDTNKKDGKYNIIHSGASPASNTTVTPAVGADGKRQLTDKEKRDAKAFGMTDDEWLQQEIDMQKEEELRHRRSA